MAGVDHHRRLGNLVAYRAALATAGLREFHRVALLCPAAEMSCGNRIVVAVEVMVPSQYPGAEGLRRILRPVVTAETKAGAVRSVPVGALPRRARMRFLSGGPWRAVPGIMRMTTQPGLWRPTHRPLTNP